MRCFICDRVIDEPQYNSDHKDYEPCDTCLTIIQELVAGYDEDVFYDIDDDFYDGYIPLPFHHLPGWSYNEYEKD